MILSILVVLWIAALACVSIPLSMRAERAMNLWDHYEKCGEAMATIFLFIVVSFFTYLPFCVWIAK